MHPKASLSHFLITLFFLLFVAAYVFAWSPPSAAPPASNVSAPLNTSSTGQTKSGGLVLNTGGAANGLIIDQGNVGIGITSPTQKLDVLGYIRAATGLCIGSDCRTSWPAGVSGSGTANALAKWTGSSTQGNSLVSDDGSAVSINAQMTLLDIFASGGRNLLLGDDTFFSDIDVAGTAGLYSTGGGYGKLRVNTPVDNNDAATKGYVDAQVGGGGGGSFVTIGWKIKPSTGGLNILAGENAPSCPAGWTEAYTGFWAVGTIHDPSSSISPQFPVPGFCVNSKSGGVERGAALMGIGRDLASGSIGTPSWNCSTSESCGFTCRVCVK